MENKYTIHSLEEEVRAAKDNYNKTEGNEWMKLVISLRALSEAYYEENKFEESSRCRKEADMILSKRHDSSDNPFCRSSDRRTIITYLDSISFWAAQEGKLRKEYLNGGSVAKYAKAVNALCEFLSLAEQYDIALELYRTVLLALHPNEASEQHERGIAYLTIVILLKASICALDAGKDNLSREYSAYPLLFLAENSKQIGQDSSIDWQYVRQLCKDLINKQENKPLNS